jgi:phosphate transport system protein
MSKHLEQDLLHLEEHVRTLATEVEQAIHLGVRALQERSASLAEQVIAGDTVIDREENRLEEECLTMLALQQPVAIDLRRVITSLKINTDLERMADLAVSIAGRAASLAVLPPVAVPAKLETMTEAVLHLVREALRAFFDLDARLARVVIDMDDEVDRLNHDIIEALIETMQQDPGNLKAWMALFSVVRNLERIADHVTNIAEGVLYIVEGQIARHSGGHRSHDG